MKNIIKSIRSFFMSLYYTFLSFTYRAFGVLAGDCRGDLATNTIGAIIVTVVIVGLLVVAVRAFFPGFFTDMFTAMGDKLNANW